MTKKLRHLAINLAIHSQHTHAGVVNIYVDLRLSDRQSFTHEAELNFEVDEWYVEYEADGDKYRCEEELDLRIENNRNDNDEYGGQKDDKRYEDWDLN